MEKCRLTIITTADGQDNRVFLDGEIEAKTQVIKVQYADNGAQVTLSVKNEEVFIEREGDYSLNLHLKKDSVCKGSIGIAGSKGEVETKAHEISYSLKEDSFLLSLQYDLLIGNETQAMKIRLLGKKI